MYLNAISLKNGGLYLFCTEVPISHEEALAYTLLSAGYKREELAGGFEEALKGSNHASVYLEERPVGAAMAQPHLLREAREVLGRPPGLPACPHCGLERPHEEIVSCSLCGKAVCLECVVTEVVAPGDETALCPECWQKRGRGDGGGVMGCSPVSKAPAEGAPTGSSAL